MAEKMKFIDTSQPARKLLADIKESVIRIYGKKAWHTPYRRAFERSYVRTRDVKNQDVITRHFLFRFFHEMKEIACAKLDSMSLGIAVSEMMEDFGSTEVVIAGQKLSSNASLDEIIKAIESIRNDINKLAEPLFSALESVSGTMPKLFEWGEEGSAKDWKNVK